ncbi:hypothetical protein EJ04DRAFT_429245 [Polyplosphaeria fusca]|uniref:Zn(2)-C6 fungal-type domain-containing protein n=1 Tax=Polyplosphaeria fusca TaxID=682080 RepID=A0A9P4V524_9PLEO|nr:hypothetical protein EJ04DRAFT_429245 [Polyplosphaeria fusca]
MDELDEPPSPVRALRDAFGDPKPPDISRKITACVSCRKQKIKCDMRDSKPPCTRCKKRGLSCTVNRSLQMLLESDTVWKHQVDARMKRLEGIIAEMATHLGPEARSLVDSRLEMSPMDESVDSGENGNSPGPDNQEVVVNLDTAGGPGAFPGAIIAPAPPKHAPFPKDLIARGIITFEKAQVYFDTYKNRLDHYRYRILGDLSSAPLEEIRGVSPLLTAAVCTVGALHLASKDFDQCYNEFVSLSASHSFRREGTVDDVRALIIGAFWLSDLSWTLVGAAVRMATELQLHKSFAKALQGDRSHYLRTRLYLLVYIGDHHYSIFFGRPPMTRECPTIRNARDFLKCEHTTEDDVRLVSQVLRWSLCSDIFDTFGHDIDRPLTDQEIPHLRRFSIALDSLRAEFIDLFNENAHVGYYPRKGVALQGYFAKLYLCSHAFRGATCDQTQSRSHEIALEVAEVRNSAVQAAFGILQTVDSDPEIQSHLNGLPAYFDIMIAFAAVFLLKVSTKFTSMVRIDVLEVNRVLSALILTLKRIVSSMHARHLLVSITRGIDSLLHRSGLSEKSPLALRTATNIDVLNQMWLNSESPGDISNWTFDTSFDPNFMGEFDLLLHQGTEFGFNYPPYNQRSN